MTSSTKGVVTCCIDFVLLTSAAFVREKCTCQSSIFTQYCTWVFWLRRNVTEILLLHFTPRHTKCACIHGKITLGCLSRQNKITALYIFVLALCHMNVFIPDVRYFFCGLIHNYSLVCTSLARQTLCWSSVCL